MNEFIGRQIDFALAVEGTRGTAETTAERNVRKVTCNLIPKVERVIDDTTFGRIEDAERVRTVRKWSEGDVEGIVHADVLGYFLLNLYGEVASTNVAGGVYDHVFTLAQNIQHPSLTLFVKDAEVRQAKIAGGMVSNFELNVTTDDYIRYTAEFIGKEAVTDSSTIPALATEYDFVSRDVVVKFADTEAGLSGATATKLKTLNITLNPNTEADYVFGNYSPDDIYNKQFTIEGDFELNYTDDTFLDLYEGNDFKYMSVTITGEANLEASYKPTITILFNKVQVTEWERASAGDDLITQSVSFKAFYNTTDEQASQITLRNLTDAYELPTS